MVDRTIDQLKIQSFIQVRSPLAASLEIESAPEVAQKGSHLESVGYAGKARTCPEQPLQSTRTRLFRDRALFPFDTTGNRSNSEDNASKMESCG